MMREVQCPKAMRKYSSKIVQDLTDVRRSRSRMDVDAEVADEIKILFRDLAAQEEKLSVDQESLTQSEMSVLRSALWR